MLPTRRSQKRGDTCSTYVHKEAVSIIEEASYIACFIGDIMIKGLSPRAQKLLMVLAQDEAKQLCSEQLVPEHLMLALLKSTESVGYRVLQYLKINISSFQIALEKSFPKKVGCSTFSEILRSRRLQIFLDVSLEESKKLKREYVGTEHFLLAAIREEQSTTSQFFKMIGYDLLDIRSAVEIVSIQMSSSLIQNRDNAVSAGIASKNSGYKQATAVSLLDEYGVDLTKKASLGELDPVIGRKSEVQRVIQILSRRNKNNPILIGEPGVGKTAIAESLAQRIVDEVVPPNLFKKRIIMLDLASVIAGTKYRGEFEERLKRIMKEIADKQNIILFMDELHTIIGAGGAEGSLDAANILKPALSRGLLQCIGATTIREYRKYIEKDAALERRFQTVQVSEPSDDETLKILQGVKNRYEEFHGVQYDDEVFEAIVRFSRRYLTDRFLPDKAIDLLDESGAMKKVLEDNYPSYITDVQDRISLLTIEKQQVIQTQNYESAAQVRDELQNLKDKYAQLLQQWELDSGKNIVTINDVCSVISSVTGIPSEQLSESDTTRLLMMEDELHKAVINQHEAIKVVSSAVRRSRTGVSSTKRPLGSFIFLGPTGVGKTLLAKTLSKFLFGSEESLVRIDMSDYMEKHNSSRLVGAPPGYVGYEEGGVLTEKIRQNPYSVILLDEIEKAHPDVFNLLLQVLEEGELRDSLGHIVNFRNTVIIMTSNAGIRKITNENTLGFSTSTNKASNYENIKSEALFELKRIMSPELINRIDDTIVFFPLSKKDVEKILDIQIKEFALRMEEQNIEVRLQPKARTYLVENGYDASLGARPMRRLIQREIEDSLAMKIISGECQNGDTVVIECKTLKEKKFLYLRIIKSELSLEEDKELVALSEVSYM